MTTVTLQAFSEPRVKRDRIAVALRIAGELVQVEGSTDLMRRLGHALTAARYEGRGRKPRDPSGPITKPGGRLL